MPPYHGSSMDITNKCPSSRSIEMVGDADEGGRSVISASNNNALYLFGAMNSKSNS